MNKNHDTYNVKIAATCLLTKVAFADDYLDPSEEKIIREILCDFFSLEKQEVNILFKDANTIMKDSTDIFSFGKTLNDAFDKEDKLDFIGCIFEVAFSDGELHYLEGHTIKSIANILNIERHELIESKMEIKRFL